MFDIIFISLISLFVLLVLFLVILLFFKIVGFPLYFYSNKSYKKLLQYLHKDDFEEIKPLVDNIVLGVYFSSNSLSARVEKCICIKGKTKITFTSRLIKLFIMSNEAPLYQLLGHELAHIKYKEFGKDTKTNEEKVLQIIEEVRADIVGKNIMKLTEDEIDNAFEEFKTVNGEEYLEKDYYYDFYPPYDDRKEYSSKYSEVTKELVKEIIDNYQKKYSGIKFDEELYNTAYERYCGRG